MLVMVLALLAILVTAVFPTAAAPYWHPQEPEPQGSEKSQAKPEAAAFFSGIMDEISPASIVVSRTILGRSPEKRSFVVNASTKVEGKLRQKSRVTVRYAPSEQGDVALSILVRERSDPPQKKK